MGCVRPHASLKGFVKLPWKWDLRCVSLIVHDWLIRSWAEPSKSCAKFSMLSRGRCLHAVRPSAADDRREARLREVAHELSAEDAVVWDGITAPICR